MKSHSAKLLCNLIIARNSKGKRKELLNKYEADKKLKTKFVQYAQLSGAG